MTRNESLIEGGIDPRNLMTAFSDADQQGVGELNLSEFRKFYGLVFPERPMTESLWRATSQMFQEIDVDGSQEITFQEILSFLENTIAEENIRTRRPDTISGYCWCFFGYGKTSWIYTRASKDFVLLTTVQLLDYLLIVMSVVSLMITTLPEHQENSDGNLQGTVGTRVMESLAGTLFLLHFVGYTYGHPGLRRPQVDPENINTAEVYSDSDDEEKIEGYRSYFYSLTTWVLFLSWVTCFVAIDPSLEVRYTLGLITFRMFRLIIILTITGSKMNVPKLGPALVKSKVSLWFLFILIVISVSISASFIFHLELEQAHFDYDLQTWYRDNDSIYLDAGSPLAFQSIPDAMWWALVTLTTVGYGDVFPLTVGGKIIAVLTILGGLVVVSYPITILTGTFHTIECERQVREERQDRARELYYGIRIWLLDLNENEPLVDFSATATTTTKERAIPIITLVDKRKDVLSRAIGLCEKNLMKQIISLEDRVEEVVASSKLARTKSPQFKSPPTSGVRLNAPRKGVPPSILKLG